MKGSFKAPVEKLPLRELVARTQLDQVTANIASELDFYKKILKGGKNSMRASNSFSNFFNRIKQQGSNSTRNSNKASQSFIVESLTEMESFNAIIEDQQNDDQESELQMFIKTQIAKLQALQRELPKQIDLENALIVIRKVSEAAAIMERTRSYCDNFMYPRDESLNLIDLQSNRDYRNQEQKQGYSFSQNLLYPFERCKLLEDSLQFEEKQDAIQAKKRVISSRQSVMIDSETLYTDDSSLDNSLSKKEIKELKKKLKNEKMGRYVDTFVNLACNFAQELIKKDANDLIKQNIQLRLTLQSAKLGSNQRLCFCLYSEQGKSFSEPVVIDQEFFKNRKFQKEIVFTGIPLKSLITMNMALIVYLQEEKPSKRSSPLKQFPSLGIHTAQARLQIATSILPLTKMFWKKDLIAEQQNEVRKESFYKLSAQIEEKYETLLEKGLLKKVFMQDITNQVALNYQFVTELEKEKLESEEQEMEEESKRDPRMSFQIVEKEDSQISIQPEISYSEQRKKSLNEFRVKLNYISLSDNITQYKSPFLRIEALLRDQYGNVYENVRNHQYILPVHKRESCLRSYESQIKFSDFNIELKESFFMQIPTKSEESLKRLHLFFFVQVAKKLPKNQGNFDIADVEFETVEFTSIPLYENLDRCIFEDGEYKPPLYIINSKAFKNLKHTEKLKDQFTASQSLFSFTVTVASNIFTSDRYINFLLRGSGGTFDMKQIQANLPKEQLIDFHGKILERLFACIADKDSTWDEKQLAFQVIMAVIDLFHTQYSDILGLLHTYVDKNMNPKVHEMFLLQINQSCAILKQGFDKQVMGNKTQILMATVKHIAFLIKIIRLSLNEQEKQKKKIKGHQSAQVSILPTNVMDRDRATMAEEVIQALKTKESKEGSEAESEEEVEDSFDRLASEGIFRNSEERNQHIEVRREQTFAVQRADASTMQEITEQRQSIKELLQSSLIQLFEGAYQDDMKSYLCLRYLLFDNLVSILDEMDDFVDQDFFLKISQFLSTQSLVIDDPRSKKIDRTVKLDGKASKGRASYIIQDYVTNDHFIEELYDFNHITIHDVISLRLVTMGQILSTKAFKKYKSMQKTLLMSFGEHIQDLTHQYSFREDQKKFIPHVLCFLVRLIPYVCRPEKKSGSLEEKEMTIQQFGARILPPVVEHLNVFLKDPNLEYHLQVSSEEEKKKLLEIIDPYPEKSTLVSLSLIEIIDPETLAEHLSQDYDSMYSFVKTIKLLLVKSVFQSQHQFYFDKVKCKVSSKILQVGKIAIQLILERDQASANNYKIKKIIKAVNKLAFFIWTKSINLSKDFSQLTSRGKNGFPDPLSIDQKGIQQSFLDTFDFFKIRDKSWETQIKYTQECSFLSAFGSEENRSCLLKILNETAVAEYQETKSLIYSQRAIFKVFHNLHSSFETKGLDHVKFTNEVVANQFKLHSFYQEDYYFRSECNKLFDNINRLHFILIECNSNLWNNTLKIVRIAQLIEVLTDLNQFELLGEYKEKLSYLHKKAGNWCEMAQLDLIYAEVMNDHEGDLGNKQAKAYLMIDLYENARRNFEKAQMFEKAVKVLDKTKDIYERQLFDYLAVAKVLKEQAELYELMHGSARQFKSYFKITFYGKKLGKFSNFSYLYAADKRDKRIEVFNKLKLEFPEAENYNKSVPPSVEEQKKKILINVIAVKPVTFKEIAEFNLPEDEEEMRLGQFAEDVPDKLKNYYLELEKNKFYIERTIKAESAADELEFDSEITIFSTKNKFPYMTKMQPIISEQKIKITGIENAVRRLKSSSDYIQDLTEEVSMVHGQANDATFLQSHVSASLESNIQGGSRKYIQVFLNDEAMKDAITRQKVFELTKELRRHVEVLRSGIGVLSTTAAENGINDAITTKLDADMAIFAGEVDTAANKVVYIAREYGIDVKQLQF